MILTATLLTLLVKVAITAPDSRHPTWNQPVDVYFRRDGGTWTLAGVERLPDGARK